MEDKKKLLTKGQIISVNIASLGSGGAGVSRYKNFVVFVPFSCPGDQILAKITLVKKNFAEAKLLKIEQKSIHRVDPVCVVFQKCGGCTWQHVSYSEQLKQKQKILEAAFNKRPLLSKVKFQKIIPSPKEWTYRNRVQIKVQKNGTYGFYAKKSHKIIGIQDCPIADPCLFKNLSSVIKKFTAKACFQKTSGAFTKTNHQKVEVYLSEQGEVQYLVKGSVTSSVGGDKQKAFAQVNQWVNQILIQDVLKYLKKYLNSCDVVYDLYCGHGNFTFPLFTELKLKRVVGVELNAQSIKLAKEQVLVKNLTGLEFVCQDVQKFLKEQAVLKGLVILDPPRVGCDKEVLFSLLSLQPSVILYISCNPQTLARDLEILIGPNSTYTIAEVQGYDMFPQTDHVESLVVLVLGSLRR